MDNLIPLIAAIAPFILWPIEIFFPYPHIVEEITKSMLLFPILGYNNQVMKVKYAVLIGIIFAFSETVLYIFNIANSGNLTILFTRLIITTLLHTLTTLTIIIPAMKDRRLIILGLFMAILIHYSYNLYIL